MSAMTEATRDALTARLAEFIVRYRTSGLCPVKGPCQMCDCFDPEHEIDRRDAAELTPFVAGLIEDAARTALTGAAEEITRVARGHAAAGRGHMTWAEAVTQLRKMTEETP
jgi:hypothetical protein